MSCRSFHSGVRLQAWVWVVVAMAACRGVASARYALTWAVRSAEGDLEVVSRPIQAPLYRPDAGALDSRGATEVYAWASNRWVQVAQFAWTSSGVWVKRLKGGICLVRGGFRDAGERASGDDLGLAFYLSGQLKRQHSTLELVLREGDVKRESGLGGMWYRWLASAPGFVQEPGSGRWLFRVITVNGRILDFDAESGSQVAARMLDEKVIPAWWHARVQEWIQHGKKVGAKRGLALGVLEDSVEAREDDPDPPLLGLDAPLLLPDGYRPMGHTMKARAAVWRHRTLRKGEMWAFAFFEDSDGFAWATSAVKVEGLDDHSPALRAPSKLEGSVEGIK